MCVSTIMTCQCSAVTDLLAGQLPGTPGRNDRVRQASEYQRLESLLHRVLPTVKDGSVRVLGDSLVLLGVLVRNLERTTAETYRGRNVGLKMGTDSVEITYYEVYQHLR